MDLWIPGGAVEAEKFHSADSMAGSMANDKVSNIPERKFSQLEVRVYWWPS